MSVSSLATFQGGAWNCDRKGKVKAKVSPGVINCPAGPDQIGWCGAIDKVKKKIDEIHQKGTGHFRIDGDETPVLKMRNLVVCGKSNKKPLKSSGKNEVPKGSRVEADNLERNPGSNCEEFDPFGESAGSEDEYDGQQSRLVDSPKERDANPETEISRAKAEKKKKKKRKKANRDESDPRRRLHLFLDVNEHQLKPFFEGLEYVTVCGFNPGDFHFMADDDPLKSGERKTDTDLKGGIISGRYESQRVRLKNLPISRNRICYIREENGWLGTSAGKFVPAWLSSTECRSEMRDGYTWKRTSCVLDTVHTLLCWFLGFLQNGDVFIDKGNAVGGPLGVARPPLVGVEGAYLPVSGAPKHLITNDNALALSLADVVQGVSTSMANCIQEVFPTMWVLLNALRTKEGMTKLEKVQWHASTTLLVKKKGQSVGPVVARRIAERFGCLTASASLKDADATSSSSCSSSSSSTSTTKKSKPAPRKRDRSSPSNAEGKETTNSSGSNKRQKLNNAGVNRKNTPKPEDEDSSSSDSSSGSSSDGSSSSSDDGGVESDSDASDA